MNSEFPGASAASGSGPSASDPQPVRVWLLIGRYSGDNAQVLALGDHLAETLGWHCGARQVKFRADRRHKRRQIPADIDFVRSDSFDPPWPDVLVSCGRYYGAVGQWLKRRSGGRIVHVQFGRIARPMADFDLLATTAQYGLPDAGNLIPLTLPLARSSAAAAAAALQEWQPRLAHLPRPLLVTLVGGPASQIRFGEEQARALLARAVAATRASGGSLICVFGRRTPGTLRALIRTAIAAETELPHLVLNWPPPEPNPYPALLALGDRFLVTADSASMLADACMTGRPVELFPLPIASFVQRFSSRGLGLSIDARRRRRGRQGLPADLLDRLRDFLVRRNWLRPWDEVRDHLHRLQQGGLLAGPGTVATGGGAREIQAGEIARITERLATLVAAKRRASGAPGPAHPTA